MSHETRRGNGPVPVQYHQFNISDEDGPTGPDLHPEHNGLVQVTDGVTIVLAGIHTGDVDVTVTLHETEPTPDSGDWQEVVEISAHSTSGDLMVRGLMDDLDEELPVLSSSGPGDYRLRISRPRPGHRSRPRTRRGNRVVPHPRVAGTDSTSDSASPE
ncbi:hypothetical protein [Streptomyces sp. AC555_RSS877]|uniref:hypothetical protein n=1 Tax=Streptomyces sp. AC555_RSS877 TaxID=2823688 RepID=UPI001C2764A2|nr:hypothetical protein [Streptomyces sp. AC555_RSS877]